MVARWLPLALLLCCGVAHAETPGAVPITYARALELARRGSPELAVARGRESVARAEIGVAGTYPNPSVIFGTSRLAARFSAGVSVPLVILGQRGAAMDASRADLVTVKVETDAAWNDVRASTAHAFVGLWLAAKTAAARSEAATLSGRLEDAVRQRVEVGAAPELERLRVHAERLRADADAEEARQLVSSAASELGRWIGMADGSALRPEGEPGGPGDAPPPLAELTERVATNPSVRREEADARAAEARASRERALVRPAMTVELGVDAFDPTLPGTNYRGQLAIEVPLFNRRGSHVDRELYAARNAEARALAQRTRLSAGLVAAYRRFEAVSARVKALGDGVLPAAEAAAVATEEAYSLGRSPLFAVIDAERTRLDARLAWLEARADRANAWIEVEYAAGGAP